MRQYGSSIRRFQDSLPSGYAFRRGGQQTSSCRQLAIVCGSLCTFCLVALFGILIAGHGIAKIVIGATYIRACPAEPLLPVYLIVGAIFPMGFYLACRLKRQPNGGCIFTCENLGFCLGVLLCLFLLSWMISGTVFYARAKESVESQKMAAAAAPTLPPVATENTPPGAVTADNPSQGAATTKNSSPGAGTTQTASGAAAAESTPPGATVTEDSSPGTPRLAPDTTEGGSSVAPGNQPTTNESVSTTTETSMSTGDTGRPAGDTWQSCDDTLLTFTLATLITEWVCAGLFVCNIICTAAFSKC